MPKPAVFFDRDNTLIASDGYLGDPAGVRLVKGAADAVARARELGFAVVTFSNQSGVARGLFTEEDVEAVDKKMDELLGQQNPRAIIDRHEFCPFHPEGIAEKYRQESDRRKPKPGMLRAAAKALDLDLESSWVIGDSPRDIEAGFAAGCRTILFTDPSLPPSPAAEAPSTIEPDESVGTLSEAMDAIEAAEAAKSAVVRPKVEQVRGQPRFGPEIFTYHVNFSFSKLIAGIVQMFTLALALVSVFHPIAGGAPLILYASFLQLFVIALVLMSAEKR